VICQMTAVHNDISNVKIAYGYTSHSTQVLRLQSFHSSPSTHALYLSLLSFTCSLRPYLSLTTQVVSLKSFNWGHLTQVIRLKSFDSFDMEGMTQVIRLKSSDSSEVKLRDMTQVLRLIWHGGYNSSHSTQVVW